LHARLRDAQRLTVQLGLAERLLERDTADAIRGAARRLRAERGGNERQQRGQQASANQSMH
jgi:hypothetical protein